MLACLGSSVFTVQLISLKLLVLVPSVICLIGVPDSAGFDTGTDNCRRIGLKNGNDSTCYELKHNLCFGTKLPYSWSTSELVHPNWTQRQLQNDLARWEGLKSSPKCWAVIQSLLCAVYMPKCQDGVIELPSQELCKVTRSPCRLVEQVMKDWPEFLKCDDPVRYPPNCKNTEIRELRFNTTSKCMDPLIPVEDPFSYYEGFEGCGLKCQDPLFTDEDHLEIRYLIGFGSLFLCLSSGFVIITYLIDWKSARGLPSVIIFYVVVCYFIANLGWMLQFLPNAKQDIVCRKDGTIRRNEHRAGENVFCILVFTLIYFGSLAALGWLAVFAYVWNLTCNAVGRIRKRVDSQAAYFHIVAWPLAGGLTILNLSLGKVDASSMSGVCFIGHLDFNIRIYLIICPMLIAFLVMFYYFSKGLYRLVNVLLSAPTLIPESGRKHLRSTVVRVVFFSLFAAIIMSTFVGTEIYQMQMRPIWSTALRESLICQMNLSDVADCGVRHRPSFGLIGLNIILFFTGGILVSSWAWTRASIHTWQRGLSRWRQSRNPEQHDPYHQPIQKHRLIAQAYQKRNEIDQNGRLSLSLISLHGDPIGLNRILDPNQLCQESNSRINRTNGEEVSSEWVAALPHLILRRNAIIVPESSNNSISEDNSRLPSEIGNKGFRASNSDLDKPTSKKRSGLSKLKEKLGSRNGIGRKGRRGSISSFESSDMGIKHYQSSNSDLEKPDPKSKSSLYKIKNKFGRRNGIGWRGHRGSMSSLESNGPVTSTKIDWRLRGGDVKKENQEILQSHKRTILVKEFSMQTSFENLPLIHPYGETVPNGTNVDMIDKCMQTSIECLRRVEFSTQTKKSATKKHKKRRQTKTEIQETNVDNENKGMRTPDPVLQLLTPG